MLKDINMRYTCTNTSSIYSHQKLKNELSELSSTRATSDIIRFMAR